MTSLAASSLFLLWTSASLCFPSGLLYVIMFTKFSFLPPRSLLTEERMTASCCQISSTVCTKKGFYLSLSWCIFEDLELQEMVCSLQLEVLFSDAVEWVWRGTNEPFLPLYISSSQLKSYFVTIFAICISVSVSFLFTDLYTFVIQQRHHAHTQNVPILTV